VLTVAVALAAVATILTAALRFGSNLSALLSPGSDESVLLAVFGLTLLVGGLAQQLDVSAAIGAFIVGLALSGPVQHRAGALIGPLRDLFAAVFFLFFSFQIRPGDLVGALAPAAGLAVVVMGTKALTGWKAAAWAGIGRPGRKRAAATLMARERVRRAAIGLELLRRHSAHDTPGPLLQMSPTGVATAAGIPVARS